MPTALLRNRQQFTWRGKEKRPNGNEERGGTKRKRGLKKVSKQLRNESQLGRLDIAARQRQRLRVVKVQEH